MTLSYMIGCWHHVFLEFDFHIPRILSQCQTERKWQCQSVAVGIYFFKGWTLWGGTGAKSSSRSRSANHVIHLSQAQHPIHQEQWGQEGAENNILYFERPRMEYKAINTKS